MSSTAGNTVSWAIDEKKRGGDMRHHELSDDIGER